MVGGGGARRISGGGGIRSMCGGGVLGARVMVGY